jgi:hypothetical protein
MRNIASCIPLFTPSDTHFDRGVVAQLISQLAAALWYVGKGGLVAQRLEQRTHNPLVVGSNPTGPTISSRPIGQAFQAALFVAFVDLVAGNPGDAELAAQGRHVLPILELKTNRMRSSMIAVWRSSAR